MKAMNLNQNLSIVTVNTKEQNHRTLEQQVELELVIKVKGIRVKEYIISCQRAMRYNEEISFQYHQLITRSKEHVIKYSIKELNIEIWLNQRF